MQQVLLAGGPYPADGLVSSLEMCSRRSGASLPAIGQLTFDHLAPLQKFVNEHCSASRVNIEICLENLAMDSYFKEFSNIFVSIQQ